MGLVLATVLQIRTKLVFGYLHIRFKLMREECILFRFDLPETTLPAESQNGVCSPTRCGRGGERLPREEADAMSVPGATDGFDEVMAAVFYLRASPPRL